MTGATRALEHALELCRAADMPVYVPLVGSPLGLAYAMAGRVSEGVVLAEQAVEQSEARRQVALLTWNLLRLSEVRLLAGQTIDARAPAARALLSFREHKERGGEAYTLRLHAVIAARTDQTTEAEALFTEVGELVQTMDMRPLAARCGLDRGLFCAAQGRSVDGRRHLSASADAFHQMGMAHWGAAALDALARFE
jgi:hypothetical protein